MPLNALRQRRKSPMRDHSAVVLPTPATLSTRGQCPPMGRADNSGFASECTTTAIRSPKRASSPENFLSSFSCWPKLALA